MTDFPIERLLVDSEPLLHRALGLYEALQWPGGAWPNLLRGTTGDRKTAQRIADDETIEARPLPPIPGSFFARAGGTGFQRPFALATVRLRNMGEVMSQWRTYAPRDQGILGFSATMARPLAFLDSYLG